MKHNIKFKIHGLVTVIAATVLLTVSCADDVVVTTDNFGKYEAVNHPYGYIKNAVSSSDRLIDLYQTGGEREIEVGITKMMSRAVDMKISIDESILTEYNRVNRQNFAMLPANLVTIGQDGVAVVPPGYTKSEPVSITIAPSNNLVKGTTYVLPLRISTDDKEVILTKEQEQYLFFVVAQGDRINPAKSAGYKVVSCMETGDADPRIHCELFLANEGKPLFDIVALFSGNLNYNAATGKVYIHMNNSIAPILNNRDRYIKPLQDMGIKVVLGLMGNHDPAGVSHLQEQTAVEFVKDLKIVVDSYGLDGIFWDDEYTAPNASIPGFSSASKKNASRLIFETKRAMPDKLNMVFAYSTISSLEEVDGVKSGEYVDFIIPNYGGTPVLNNWPGATSKQGMPRPYEFALRTTGSPSTVVSGNWGGIMVFALSEHRDSWNSFGLPALRTIASTMFNDQLNYTGVSYPVEW